MAATSIRSVARAALDRDCIADGWQQRMGWLFDCDRERTYTRNLTNMQCAARKLVVIGALLLAGAVTAHASQPSKPIESAHRAGPNGLEGWIENTPFAHGQRYPTTLVIAQRGRVIRRIKGDPFVWKWRFWEDGKQVVYQTGSLHFNLSCIRVDLSSGRQLANDDCYRELTDAAPAWEKALQDAR